MTQTHQPYRTGEHLENLSLGEIKITLNKKFETSKMDKESYKRRPAFHIRFHGDPTYGPSGFEFWKSDLFQIQIKFGFAVEHVTLCNDPINPEFTLPNPFASPTGQMLKLSSKT